MATETVSAAGTPATPKADANRHFPAGLSLALDATTTDACQQFSHGRVGTMLEATYQAAALHELLAGVLAALPNTIELSGPRRQAEALLMRLHELNSILMSGLGDDVEATATLEHRLHRNLPKSSHATASAMEAAHV